MSRLTPRTLGRYAIVAAIVIVVGGLFLRQQLGSDDSETVLDDGSVATVGLLDDRSVGIGEPVPDLILRSVDGSLIQLSDFRGKTVVLNFWATWCPPCRAEMPDFQALFEERESADDLVIIAVDKIDEDSVSAVEKFVVEFELTFPIVFDTAGVEVYNRFGVRGLPATFFIDRDGILRAQNFGPVFGNLLEEGVAAADAAGAATARR